uniref:Fibronectin type III domain-containing protein n=1 Tax=Candidatus Kentrum eta TaxID=2126337 RepID=A0A450UNY8_9GAMM|nr:MAG: Fibronectin type III domain-containing protein [Candidatus Kentron sp. H]VFJ94180.1 MAG: Fibronectin type III domain-containing protein [Candidatus Kentron sp. H]VFK00864.1 MAG: Fibronectin type III domain-containing protein [Candidatus Kentron sp. H]
MATFPREEAKILTLAQEMVDGFNTHTDIYPAPTIGIADFETILAECITAREGAIAAQAAAEEATAIKQKTLQALIGTMKTEIRYAENIVDYDDAKLKLIGWGGPRARTPLTAPGQTRSLTIRHQGEGRITLAWKKPADGGKVAAYKVQRRERLVAGSWLDAGVATRTEITLSGQEQGKELEYCIVALNNAGEGEPGNIVTVVL